MGGEGLGWVCLRVKQIKDRPHGIELAIRRFSVLELSVNLNELKKIVAGDDAHEFLSFGDR